MSSCKERQAKRRARIKQDKELYDACLDKDRKRKAARLATLKSQMSQSQIEEQKLRERLRLRKYRENKSWKLKSAALKKVTNWLLALHTVLLNHWEKH